MFKFHFDELVLGDAPRPQKTDMKEDVSVGCTVPKEKPFFEPSTQQCSELSVDDLLSSLPHALSYSPIVIPLSSTSAHSDNKASLLGRHEQSAPISEKSPLLSLPRRDLFDARYQLIQEDGEAKDAPNAGAESTVEEGDEVKFFDDPSDLVPGVYEGGLKTWECALSLVECLDGLRTAKQDAIERIRGRRVLEIGCGTAIPSIYLLYRLFEELATPADEDESGRNRVQTEFVLQDYNSLVLRLVTFPNILLAWYASPLAKSFRERRQPATDEEADVFDVNQQGDLTIDPELVSAFRQSLVENNVSLRLIAGSWTAVLATSTEGGPLIEGPFDVVLTSETIYQPSSLETLISLLETACGKRRDAGIRSSADYDCTETNIDRGVQQLALEQTDRQHSRSPLCLIAAKVLYFGVGGGILDFEKSIERRGGRTTTVLNNESGVGRKVLRVEWW